MNLKSLFIALVAIGCVIIVFNDLDGPPSATRGTTPSEVDSTATTLDDSPRRPHDRPSSAPLNTEEARPLSGGASSAASVEEQARVEGPVTSGSTSSPDSASLGSLRKDTQSNYGSILGERADGESEENAISEEQAFRENERLRARTQKNYSEILDN